MSSSTTSTTTSPCESSHCSNHTCISQAAWSTAAVRVQPTCILQVQHKLPCGSLWPPGRSRGQQALPHSSGHELRGTGPSWKRARAQVCTMVQDSMPMLAHALLCHAVCGGGRDASSCISSSSGHQLRHTGPSRNRAQAQVAQVGGGAEFAPGLCLFGSLCLVGWV
jgi:hypothetical protein